MGRTKLQFQQSPVTMMKHIIALAALAIAGAQAENVLDNNNSSGRGLRADSKIYMKESNNLGENEEFSILVSVDRIVTDNKGSKAKRKAFEDFFEEQSLFFDRHCAAGIDLITTDEEKHYGKEINDSFVVSYGRLEIYCYSLRDLD